MFSSFCFVLSFSYFCFCLSRQIHQIDLSMTKLFKFATGKTSNCLCKMEKTIFCFNYYHRSDDRQMSLISRNVPSARLARLARLPVVNARMKHNQEDT